MTDSTVNNKSLSIRVCSNGLSFCVYSPTDDEPFTYKELDINHTISLAANLKQALADEPLLQSDYQRVNVMVTTPHFTTVPVSVFDKEQLDSVYQTVFPKDNNSHVSYNVLRRSGIAIVFGLDKNVYQLLKDDFPRARFYASGSTLIEHFGERSNPGHNRQMFAYIHEKEVTLYVFEKGRMLFVNNYVATDVSDIQYYILNVWKQLDMSQTDDVLGVVGDIPSRIKDVAGKITYFLQNVEVIDPKEDFLNKLTSGNSTIPYDLQTLLICGF